jgi:hypothetical protein
MNQQEMRAALSVGLERFGGIPDSMPDAFVEQLFKRSEKRKELAKAQRNLNAANRELSDLQKRAGRTGAIVVTASEQERLEAHRRIIQADLLQ